MKNFNHIHNYHLLGQFEGTPKMYQCECGDQVEEGEIVAYIDYMRDNVLEAQSTGN